MNWWNELTGLQQIFASIAIPATLIMVTQFILLLFGLTNGDGADGVDAPDDLNFGDEPSVDIIEDSDGNTDVIDQTGEGHDNVAGLRLFTLRSIVAFFSIGGWMGVAAVDWKVSTALAIVLAFVAGWLALYFVAWSIQAILRLQQTGNVRFENAVGKDGEVYIPISENGLGKVNVLVQDRLCEMNATTQAGRVLKTGEKITVLGVSSEGVLLVAPKDSPERADHTKIFKEVP